MRLASVLLLSAALASPALADAGPANAGSTAPAKRVDLADPKLADTVPPHPLPAPVTTDHVLTLPGRTLRFKATAGAVRLGDAASGAPIADIGFTSYVVEGADPELRRPLTIALNGGPGASSAWLDLGAIGPWRLPVSTADLSPSMPARVIDNADTWLDFTDLLFIDPAGTGYSRMLGAHEEAQKRFYSVDGDIDELATVVRKWLVANDRLLGPHFIVGESYGGFRAPKLARKLERTEGVGIDGLVMLSPVLDFAWFFDDNPAMRAARLPSLVAAAKGIKGPNPRDRLQAVESYASGPYLVDLYRGLRDPAAIKRMSTTVAAFTGLDETMVRRLAGRVDAAVMTRETNRDAGRVASAYDGTVTGLDPNPYDAVSHHADPILDALATPMASAMADVTANRLKWPVNARYEILNPSVNGHWDWDVGRHQPEATGDLASLLALDPHLHAIVMHGVSDQVTPYFASKMLIDQLPPYGDPGRIRLAVYGGGHMPYLEDASRAAMREDARRLITGEGAMGQP